MKDEQTKKGKGWREKQEEVLTEKGIEKKAPIHRKVALKKEAGKALNTPMKHPKPENIIETKKTVTASGTLGIPGIAQAKIEKKVETVIKPNSTEQ